MMKQNLKFLLFTLLILPNLAVGADSLSYSGRLTNANGSPVMGPVKLKFDLAYTDDLTYLRCSYQIDSVDLINGVFHSKLVFNCPSSSLKKVIEETPANHSIAIRVTDLSAVPTKVYSYQVVHSLPFSLMSEMSKQLVQMGATDGQVLTWSSSGWIAADPASTTNGTVTSITATDGLYGGPITDSGIIGLADGGVTSQKLNQMGATPGQVLKWTLAGWAPDTDNDTTPAAESDPHVLKFARSDMLGMPIPDNCAADEKLQYAPAMQTFVCSPIILNDSAVQSAVVADAINDKETEKAPSQNAVFDALAGKQDTIDQSTDLTVKSLKIQTDGSTWMGLVAPATSSNISFTLPGVDGQINQVLKTDGSGNLGWTDINAGTITGITTSAPLSGSGTSGSINISLAGDSISNTHIASGANIDWAKINKTGAAASDLGAVPSTRSIATGTGLLGGGDLSSNRTLSLDVGTGVGQILQVGLDGKLPTVDGSKLSNLNWSQILTSTLPVITAGTGMTTSGSLVSGQTLNVDVGTGDGQIVQVQTGGKLPALDGSQLTNLGSNLGKWSDATGGIQYSGGHVGITTSSPEEKIHIHAETGVLKSALRTSWIDTNSYGEWNAYEGTTFMGGITVMGSNVLQADWRNAFLMTAAKNDLGSLIFRTRTSNVYEERMVVKNDGKVGIGTINPTAKLSVYDSIDNSGIIVNEDTSGLDIYNNDSNPGSYALLRLMSFGAGNLASSDGNYFMSKANANNDIDLFVGKFTSGGGDQNLMTFKSNGKIGVGTVNPITKFQVADIYTNTTDLSGLGISVHGSGNDYGGITLWDRDGDTATSNDGDTTIYWGDDVTESLRFAFKLSGSALSEKMRITSAGDVGIGTLSPTSKLHVNGNTAVTGDLIMAGNDSYIWTNGTGTGFTGIFDQANNRVLFYASEASGNVGVGTSTPNEKLHVAGNIYANMGEGFRLKGDSNYFGTNNDGIIFEMIDGNHTNGSTDGGFVFRGFTPSDSIAKEWMVIKTPGNVGIGTTSPSDKLHVVGNIRTTGCLYYNGGTTGTCVSDQRLKEDVKPFQLGLDEVLGINPVFFNYNGLGGMPTDGGRQLGVIAQELEKVAPSLVVKRKIKLHSEDKEETEIKAVDYGAFTYALINATKDLYGMIADLFSRDEENKREIASVKEENAQMKAYICKKDPEAPFCHK